MQLHESILHVGVIHLECLPLVLGMNQHKVSTLQVQVHIYVYAVKLHCVFPGTVQVRAARCVIGYVTWLTLSQAAAYTT